MSPNIDMKGGDNMIELTSIYGNGFTGIFITRDGELISNRQNKQIRMKTYFDKQGYEYCKIWDNVNKRYKHISIHITVAMAYIPNPDNKETVNHKDRIKSHNYVDNLEWMTLKENVAHASNGLRNNTMCELWKDGVFIKQFASKSQASRYAADQFGVGADAMRKYGKSHGCVIIEGVTTRE